MTIGDYLSRLVFALPLVLALAMAAIYAVKRGWLRAPSQIGLHGREAPLKLVQSMTIGAGVRLLVVDFEAQRLVLAISRSGVTSVVMVPQP